MDWPSFGIGVFCTVGLFILIGLAIDKFRELGLGSCDKPEKKKSIIPLVDRMRKEAKE